MYAICRALKLKGNDVAASHNHCERTEERKSLSSHIDEALTPYNLIEHNETFEEFIKRNNVKIPRKDSVLEVEYMLTLSPEYFDGCDRTKGYKDPKIREFVDGVTEFLNREGKNNTAVLDWHLHLDEETPHIHAHVVIFDYNKKKDCILNASKVLDGRKKLTELQDRYYFSMNQRVKGLKRGISADITGAKHMTLKEVKNALGELKKAGLSREMITNITRELIKNPQSLVNEVIKKEYERPGEQSKKAEELKQNPPKKNDKGFFSER
jgi:hypothetical protein